MKTNKAKLKKRMWTGAAPFLSLLAAISLWPFQARPQPMMSNEHGISASSSWTQVKSEDGIDLYIRLITMEGFPEGRQLGVTFRMQGDVSTAVKLVSDDRLASRWMSAVKSFRVLEQKDKACWYSYMLYDIPWPLRKQDLIAVNTLSAEPDGSCASIEMRSAADYLPENTGVSRILHMAGTWQFKQVSASVVEVSYTIFSGQKSSFPRWITDPIIQGNMIRTMNNFRELGEAEYTSARSISRKD